MLISAFDIAAGTALLTYVVLWDVFLNLYILNYCSYGKRKREVENFGDVNQFNKHHHRTKRYLLDNTNGSPTLQGITACALLGLGLIFAFKPPPGLVPSDQPQPGTPGGGGLPSENNPGNVLSLVPQGLTPIATFPPFATCRTVPAVAVIWKEPSNTNEYRSPYDKRRPLRYSRRPHFLESISKNLRCLQPRLKERFGKKSQNGYHGKICIIVQTVVAFHSVVYEIKLPNKPSHRTSFEKNFFFIKREKPLENCFV